MIKKIMEILDNSEDSTEMFMHDMSEQRQVNSNADSRTTRVVIGLLVLGPRSGLWCPWGP